MKQKRSESWRYWIKGIYVSILCLIHLVGIVRCYGSNVAQIWKHNWKRSMGLRMKVKNNTHWNTADFKRILQRVALEELETWQRRRLVVEIKPMRGRQNGYGWCGGRAHLRSTWMQLRVPGTYVDPVDFAFVAAHEMAHCRGLTHVNMKCPRYRRMGDRYRVIYAPLVQGLTIMQKPPRQGPSAYDKLVKALAHSQAMLKGHLRRLRLQQTVTKRWQRRARYYERRLEALAAAQGVRRAD